MSVTRDDARSHGPEDSTPELRLEQIHPGRWVFIDPDGGWVEVDAAGLVPVQC